MKIVLCIALLALELGAKPVSAIEFSIGSPVIDSANITVTASLSGSTNNYYLQGVLRSVGSSKYFGETQNNKGQWIDYVSSPDKEYIANNFLISDVKDASWSGKIAVRFKADDPNYQGPGQYELKLRRYTGSSSSSAGDSNTIIVTLSVPLPAPSPSPTPSPSPSPSSIPSPSPIPASPSPTPVTPTANPIVPSPVLSPPPAGTVAGDVAVDLSAFGLPSTSPSPTLTSHSERSWELNKQRALTVALLGMGCLTIAATGYGIYRRRIKTIKYNE